MVSDLSCATFTASVSCVPAATLVIWRLIGLLKFFQAKLLPTETAPILGVSVDLNPFSTVLAPSVTEKVCFAPSIPPFVSALEKEPNATPLVTLTDDW